MSRSIFAAGLLLASVPLAQAGDSATFSPYLIDPPAATAAPSAAAHGNVAQAAPPGRSRASKRRTRYAAAHTPRLVADAAPKLDASGVKSLTIGGIPAPLPPGRDGGDAAEAVATLEAAPRSPNTESAAPGPSGRTADRGNIETGSETVGALLAKHALANGVPLKLAQAVVTIESRGNAHASNHGALGLMQIKYGTARSVGFAGPAVALFVADTNLRYGMKVLAQAWRDAGGDLCGALMRYQSGHMARHASAANRAYCSRARSLMASR